MSIVDLKFEEQHPALRSPAVLSLDDFDVGPAPPTAMAFHEDRPVACVRLGDILEACVKGARRAAGLAPKHDQLVPQHDDLHLLPLVGLHAE